MKVLTLPLTAFCRVDELGLVGTGSVARAAPGPALAVLACRGVEPDGLCRRTLPETLDSEERKHRSLGLCAKQG